MTSGTSLISRVLALYILLLAGNAAGAADQISLSHSGQADDGWTVEQVVASLKKGREASVHFEEATYSSLLTEPLVVRGLLRFQPPSRLEKEVLEPYRERYVIEGDQMTFESERKGVKKTISLEDYPALRSFVDALRAAFTGDAVQLRQIYETQLDGDRRKWTLLLRPRDQAGQAMVDSILFSGTEGRLATITVRAPDGDRSVLTLSRGSPP
ncbi:MAG: LolA-related protein [Nitrospiraceae bacterium]